MRTKKAFTLIELLVVIAIIALLLGILIPSLRLAKQKAASIVCMTNAKNLSLAWFMYKEDSGSWIMSAQMDGTEDSGNNVRWIGTPRDINGSLLSITQANPPVTDEDEIRGIEKGRLDSYVKSPDAYTCPADRVKSKYDGTEKLVTFAVANCLYGSPRSSSTYYKKQIRKFDEITSPAMRYVFVETAETRNWTMSGHFVMGAPEYTGNTSGDWAWWGPMAVNHGNSSVLGFCDGHGEVHAWKDAFTKARIDKLIAQNTDLYNQEYPPYGQVEDIAYMAQGWAYRYKP